MIIDMQRPALIASAALRVMHPQLYWASVATHLELGRWSKDQGLVDMHHLLSIGPPCTPGRQSCVTDNLPNIEIRNVLPRRLTY
jgi:hypothetical protein